MQSGGGRRRARELPLRAHVALLLVLLLALVPVVGWHDVVTADEGAMLAQLELLDSSGEWTAANPEPDIDPAAEALPLEKSDRTSDGRWAPFLKHPVHIMLLWPVYALAGTFGIIITSALATVTAAVCAALLARRIDERLAVPTLWLAGVGSPLLFDGYLVLGHALGAAFFGAAAVAAVAFIEGATARTRLITGLGTVTAVALTALIRAEGVLAGVALGAMLGLIGLIRRRPAWMTLGAALGLTAAAARELEPRLSEALLGSPSIRSISIGELNAGSFLTQRRSAFDVTMLRTAYVVDAADVALFVGVAVGVLAVVYVRLGRDPRLVGALATGAAVLALGRVFEWGSFVPGLLMACPAIAMGIAGLRVATLRRHPIPVLAGTSLLFTTAVLLTQYDVGGSGEWGGRYFAVGLPVVLPVVIASLADLGTRARRPIRPVLVVTIAAATVAMGALAVGTVRNARDGAGRVADAVVAAAGPSQDRVVVTTHGATARFAWRSIDEGRWFSVQPAGLQALTSRLQDAGIEHVTLVTREPDRDLAVVTQRWQVTPSEPVPGWTIATLTPA